MKTYSDLLDIDPVLTLQLHLEPVGNPEYTVLIANNIYGCGKLFKPITIDARHNLLKPFSVQIELKNKIYDLTQETALIIRELKVDDIDLVPKFDYLAQYRNDHNNNDPTSYLGYNGKWTLTFDRPFYQWLHQATGQGWLLS